MRASVIAFALSMMIVILASILLILAISYQASSWLIALLGTLVVLPIPVATVLLYFVLKPYLDL
ncbi:MAG: hypothetical protein ACYDAR_01110 [Thermomicrobiales bacterium]